jgi:putative toxin-antitoxin system antitoxin component (TIGR02293 family)
MTGACAGSAGRERLFELPPRGDVPSVIRLLNGGLPVACFNALSRASGLKEGDLARLARIPARTMARRKKEGVFPLEEGERVLRLMRIVERAMELFEGNADEAAGWLKSANPLLEGKSPLEYADTEPGAQLVQQVIGRLEHGVFS